MTQVTRILAAIEQGDPVAAEQLLPLVYDELRRLAAQRLAQEKPGQTLQATALVHEAYLRLVDAEGDRRWDGRGHFFSAAAEAMCGSSSTGRAFSVGGGGAAEVDGVVIVAAVGDVDLLVLDEALDRLAARDAEAESGQAAVLCGLIRTRGSHGPGRLGARRASLDVRPLVPD